MTITVHMHDLKILSEFFGPIKDGSKTFEIRNTNDRDFQVGDTLVLREYDPIAKAHTGQLVTKTVSHIMRHIDMPSAVPMGYAIISLSRDPVDILLFCPKCGVQHVDAPEDLPMAMPGSAAEGSAGWTDPVHRSHLCRPQDGGCGHIWRPADVATNGVSAIATRGKVDSPIANPKDVGSTITLAGHEFKLRDLLRRAMLNLKKPRDPRVARWFVVRDTFAVGSTVSAALCREFELNPDEGMS